MPITITREGPVAVKSVTPLPPALRDLLWEMVVRKGATRPAVLRILTEEEKEADHAEA